MYFDGLMFSMALHSIMRATALETGAATAAQISPPPYKQHFRSTNSSHIQNTYHRAHMDDINDCLSARQQHSFSIYLFFSLYLSLYPSQRISTIFLKTQLVQIYI